MSTASPPTDAPAIADVPVPTSEERIGRQEELRAWGREMDWLDAQYTAGALRPYADEYVITADHIVLAHSRDLDAAYTEAEWKADELGIPHWRLVNYFVCCS